MSIKGWECPACGIVLDKRDDIIAHDDDDCIAWMEMIANYYHIIG